MLQVGVVNFKVLMIHAKTGFSVCLCMERREPRARENFISEFSFFALALLFQSERWIKILAYKDDRLLEGAGIHQNLFNCER